MNTSSPAHRSTSVTRRAELGQLDVAATGTEELLTALTCNFAPLSRCPPRIGHVTGSSTYHRIIPFCWAVSLILNLNFFLRLVGMLCLYPPTLSQMALALSPQANQPVIVFPR